MPVVFLWLEFDEGKKELVSDDQKVLEKRKEIGFYPLLSRPRVSLTHGGGTLAEPVEWNFSISLRKEGRAPRLTSKLSFASFLKYNARGLKKIK